MNFNCVVLGLTFALAAGQFPRWDRIPLGSTRVVGRSGHMAITNETHVMIVGGENAEGFYPDTSIAYNFITREVLAQPNPTHATPGTPPQQINRAAWAQTPGTGQSWFFSGRQPPNENNGAYLFGVWRYDSNLNQMFGPFGQVGTQPAPPGRELASGAWLNTCFFNATLNAFEPCFVFFGGFRGTTGSAAQVWQVIPRGSNAVQYRVLSIPGAPTPRWNTMAGVSAAGDILYLIGGDTATGSVNDIWAYAPAGFPDIGVNEYDNVARNNIAGVVAQQSSNFEFINPTTFRYDATRAIDGLVTWAGATGTALGQCSHTNTSAPHSTNPWWMVDLGQVRRIDNIRIFQRTDCCRGRNAGYRIYASTVRTGLEWNEPGNIQIPTPTSDIIGQFDDVPAARGVEARYLWVMLPGPNRILTICEFEVWVRRRDVWRLLSGQYNAALLKPAFMSSKDNNAEENQLGGGADMCVDGNTGGAAPDWCKSSTVTWVTWPAPTAPPPRVFWYVDLGFTHDIQNIDLFARTDSPGRVYRTSRYEVYIGNSRQFEGNALCAGSFNNLGTTSPFRVNCPGFRGRFVHVRKIPNNDTVGDANVMEMGEVRVNANRLTNQPIARSGAAYAVYAGYLVMFGGRDSAGVLLNDVRLFDLLQGVWLPPLVIQGTPPLPRAFATLTPIPNAIPGNQFQSSPGNALLLFGGVGSESPLGDMATISFTPCPRLTVGANGISSLSCSQSDTVCAYQCQMGAAAHNNKGRPLRCGLDGNWIGITPYCLDTSGARSPPNVGTVTLTATATNVTLSFKALVAFNDPVVKYSVQARTNAYVQQFTESGFFDASDWALWTPYRPTSHVYGFNERSLFMNLENAQDCWGGAQFCMILMRSVPTSVVPTVESNWAVETFVRFDTSNTYVPLDNNQFGLVLVDANETRWAPLGSSFRGQAEIFCGIRRASGQYQVGWEQPGSRWSFWVQTPAANTFAWLRLERMWHPNINLRRWRFGFKFASQDQWTFVFPRFENTLDRGPGNLDTEFLPPQHLRVGLIGKNGQGLRVRAYAEFSYFRISPIDCTDTGPLVEVPQPPGATTNTDVVVTVPGLDPGRQYMFAVRANNGQFWSRQETIAPAQVVGQPANFITLPTSAVPRYNISQLVEVASGRNRPVTQSSNVNTNPANFGSAAFDGNLLTQSHTGTGNVTGEWLQVDLGIETSIKAIRLFNRFPDQPCPFCPDRLNGFQVFVSSTTYFRDAPSCRDTPFNITSAENGYSWLINTTLNPQQRVLDPRVAGGERPMNPAVDWMAEWACPLTGRYVTVALPATQGIGGSDGFLHIREVMVFAANSCPPRPTHPLAEAVPGTVCSGATLGSVCAHRCQPGYVPIAGDATATCNGENWDRPGLVCAPECPVLPEPDFSGSCMRSIFSESFDTTWAVRNSASALSAEQAVIASKWQSYFPATQGFGEKWFALPSGNAGNGYLAGAANTGCDDGLYAFIADAKVSGHRGAFKFEAVVSTPDRAGIFFRSINRQNMYVVYVDAITGIVALDAMLSTRVTRLSDVGWNDQVLAPYLPLKLSVQMEGVMITVFVNDFFAFETMILDRTLLAGNAGVYAATNATFDDVRFLVPCDGSVQGATNGDVATFGCRTGLYAEGPLMRTCVTNAGGMTADWVPSVANATICRLAPPVMIPQTLFVPENSPRNALVGNPIVASIDSPDFQLQFKIDSCAPVGGGPSCSATSPFFIDVCTGQVRVRTAILDFETTPSYNLVIRAYVAEFAATSFATLTYRINLINVDEPPVVVPRTYTLLENSVGGTIVGNVQIVDPENDPFTATIQLVSAGGQAYELTPFPAVIRVRAGTMPGELNFENAATATVQMVVVARQDSNPNLLGTAEMTIRLNDTNDIPVIAAGQAIFLQEAQSAPGTRNTAGADAAVPVAGIDEDAGQTATLTYTILTAAQGAQSSTCNISAKYPTTDGTAAGAPLFSISSTGLLRMIEVPAGITRYNDLAARPQDPYAAFGRLLWADYLVCVRVQDAGTPALSGHAAVPVGIVAPSQAIPVIQTTTMPFSLSTAGGQSVTFLGSGFGNPGQYLLVVTYSQVGNAALNYSASCSVTSDTVISCLTAPGVGTNFRWNVNLNNRRAIDVNPVTFSYTAPSVLNVTANMNLPTVGASQVVFSGDNFGPVGAGLAITYGPLGNPTRFSCLVSQNATTAHTRLICVTPAGAGADLRWTITVGGQSVSAGVDSTQFISYAAPVITLVNGTAAGISLSALSTRGGQDLVINGNNFGPLDVLPTVTYGGATGNILVMQSCFKAGPTAHTRVTCRTVAGVGSNHKVTMSVESVPAAAPWPAVGGISYASPVILQVSGAGINNMDTAGGTSIEVRGTGFGPTSWALLNANFISLTYGKQGDVGRYTAANCRITTLPTDLQDSLTCSSAPGVGRGHVAALTIEGQAAPVFNASLSYAAPQVFFFAGPGSENARTQGNDDVIITGRNFGPNDAYTIGLLNVSYSTEVRGGPPGLTRLVFIPPGSCAISQPHTELTCKTAEGAGADFTWTVFVDSVQSRNPATGYAAPVIDDIVEEGSLLPVSNANVDGGTVVLVRGNFFGPLAYRSIARPLIQSVTFGSTGSEYTVPTANWQLQSPGHTVIRVVLPPGSGLNLRFRVAVADQSSAASTATFSYQKLVIESLSPVSANTYSDPRNPTLINARVRYAPVRDPLTRIELMFGNGASRQRLPLTVPSGPVAIAAATNPDGTMNFLFALPRDGGGVDLGVRLDVVPAGAAVGTDPIVSSDIVVPQNLFSYDPPRILDVILTTARFLRPNTTDPDTDAVPCPFPAGNNIWRCNAEMYQLTLLGENFGQDPALLLRPDGVTKTLELLLFDDGFEQQWSVDRLWPVSYTHNRIVVFTARQTGTVRLTLSSTAYSGSVVSRRVTTQYQELSPQISNIQGDFRDVPTTGQRMGAPVVITLGVYNLILSDDIQVLVGGVAAQLCPTAACITTLGTAAERKAYIDQETVRLSSLTDKQYNIFARVPPGQGSAVPVVVMRTKAGRTDSSNTGIRISYVAPRITGMHVLLADSPTIERNPNPEGILSVGNPLFRVVAPTDGTAKLRIRGSDLGVSPRVRIADGWSVAATPCAGPEGPAHTCVEITIPEGEGRGTQFEEYGERGYPVLLVAGDQDTDVYRFEYAAPVVDSVAAPGGLLPTQGGSIVVLRGSNFGARRQGRPDSSIVVTFGDGVGPVLLCGAVNRTSHTQISCVLPEGGGRGLFARVQVADLAGTTPNRLTYDRPVITSATISSGITQTVTGLTRPVLRGNTTGGDVVELMGSNFGIQDPSNCVFLSWANRAAGELICDGREGFLGEGEIPYDFGTTILAWDHGYVAFLVPAGLGNKEVQLSIRGNTLLASAVTRSPDIVAFRYMDPVIVNVQPGLFDTEGNEAVSLTGLNLGPSPRNTSRPDLRLPSENFIAAGRTISLAEAAGMPTAYILVVFHRACVTLGRDVRGVRFESTLRIRYATDTASTDQPVDRCSDAVSDIGHTGLRFISAAGIGRDRFVTVHVIDPVDGVIASSAPVTISYYAPLIELFSPSIVYLAGNPDVDADSRHATVRIMGRYFGDDEKAAEQRWSVAERRKEGKVGGFDCTTTEDAANAGTRVTSLARRRQNGETSLMCDIDQTQMPAGYRNVSVLIAGQTGFRSAEASARTLLFVCKEGFYGRVNETCLPCPAQDDNPSRRGARCPGYLSLPASTRTFPDDDARRFTYPRPLRGWYNLNSSDFYTARAPGNPSMLSACPPGFQHMGRDVCIMPCDPQESCLGDNWCAEGYTSKPPMWRCSSCDSGYYKRAGECIKCPDSPGALFVGFILLVMFVAVVGFFLNKKQINIAVVSIGVDFFQVLAIFAQARVKWPPIVKEILHVLSAFNLNIEIVAPECLIPDVSYRQKFWFIMLLPLCIAGLFLAVYLSMVAYKAFVLGQPKKLWHTHSPTMVSSCLVLLYLLYLYLTRTIFDVFNCGPTFPPDGKQYLQVVFEECGVPGGTQLTLLPYAIAGLAVYTFGYPAFIGYTIWKNREIVMEDQLLRAKGTGEDKLSNPRAFQFRMTYGRSYFQFKPDYCMWVLAIILRKFFIAITAVVFGKNSSFQMAACLLVMFLAYAAQVQIRPYMGAGDFEEVTRSHTEASYHSAIHARLRASLAGIESRGKKRARKNLINFDGKVDRAAVLGVLTGFFFNYNSVEAIMQFCAVIVCLMAIMYQANELSSYYPESKDSVTAVLMIIIIWAIVYFFTVLITEIVVLYNEDVRTKQLAKQAKAGRKGEKKSGDEEERTKPKSSGGNDNVMNVGNVESTANPMFMMMGKNSNGDSAPTLVNGGDSAVEALLSMKDSPPTELWRVFQSSFADMSSQLKASQAQVAELKRAVQTGGGRGGTGDDAGPSKVAVKARQEFGPKGIESETGKNTLRSSTSARQSGGFSMAATRKAVRSGQLGASE